jgi:hypothetical protein
MSLLQLISNSVQNSHVEHQYSFDYHSYIIQNNKLIIPSNGDLIEPLYLKVKQFDNVYRLKEYKILIGGSTILEMDMNFVSQLLDEPYFYQNGYMIYKLGFMDFFQHEIIKIAITI